MDVKEKTKPSDAAFIVWMFLWMQYRETTTYQDVVRAVKRFYPNMPELKDRIWNMIRNG